MESPRPLPSVFLETSPRMNRSVSSSAEMFRGWAEIFFSENVTAGFSTFISAYTLVFSMAYFATFPKTFSRTLHSLLPSAQIIASSSSKWTIRVRFFSRNFSSNSPITWCTSSTKFRSAISREIFPVLALDASTTSSVRFLSLWAFSSRMSRYPQILGSVGCSLFKRSI